MNNKIIYKIEPVEAFPYKPPNAEIYRLYPHLFELKNPLPLRLFKLIFDKSVAIIFLLLSAPIFLIIKIGYLFEGFLIPENKGPMFFYYKAISAGKIIPKYKMRLIKTKYRA